MRSLCHGLHTNSDGGGPLVGLMVGKWLDSNQIMPQKHLHCRIDTAELAYDKFRLSQNELGSECPKMCVCVDQMGAWRSSIWSPIFGKSLWPSPALLLALCTVKAGTCPLKFLKTIETISDKRAALLNTQEKAWRSISEYWSSVASLLLSTSHIDHLLLSTSPTLKPRGALFNITPCVKHSIWKRALISAPHT